jgi:ATP diphosphatase
MPEGKVKHGNNETILSQVSDRLPLMGKAMRLQAKAAEFGFDWPTIEPIFDKLQEEIDELKYELTQLSEDAHNKHDKHLRLQDELGDVLFCCMNLARFLKVDPEKALQSTNQKFERRFNFIEEYVVQQGKKMQDLSLEELDEVWDLAKEKGL